MPANVVILIELVIIIDTILLDIRYCYKLFRFFKYGSDNNTYSNHTITAAVTCFLLLVLFCSSIIMERTALY